MKLVKSTTEVRLHWELGSPHPKQYSFQPGIINILIAHVFRKEKSPTPPPKMKRSQKKKKNKVVPNISAKQDMSSRVSQLHSGDFH